MRRAERDLYEALVALQHRAERARERRGEATSQRDVVSDADRLFGAKFSGARISDWVPPPGKVERGERKPITPRDFEPLWVLVRVWSAWARERPDERDWTELVEAAQPPRGLGAGPAPPVDVPIALPLDIPAFIGRDDQLAQLREALDPASSKQRLQAVGIEGMAGVGKTVLALQVAHEAVRNGWFPGGALFVDLQGYDEERNLSADQAAAELVEQAEGKPGAAFMKPSAQLTAYRRMLRAARGPVLVVLDNASSADQIAPLRPSGGGHRLLVTSRYKLPTLSGVRKIGLGVMTHAESIDLIGRRLRDADPNDVRADQQPEEAGRLVNLCGHLPLALHIVAALLEVEPSRPLARLADELTDERGRLELLHPGDADEAPVRAAFAVSYHHLGPGDPERGDALRRLFRLLPCGPFPDPSTFAAAAMLERPVNDTRPLLRELARAHLIETGRRAELWRMHDLVYLYAGEQAMEHESLEERSAAFSRAGSAEMYRIDAAHTSGIKWAGRMVARFNGWGDTLAWPDADRSGRLLQADELAERTGYDNAFDYLKAGIIAFGVRHLPGESPDDVLHTLQEAMRALDETMEHMAAVEPERPAEEPATGDDDSNVTMDDLAERLLSGQVGPDVARAVIEGRHDEAIELLTEAATALRSATLSPFYEACVMRWIGDIRAQQGRFSDTRRAWRRAIELLTSAGNTAEAERIQAQLRRLPPPRTTNKRRHPPSGPNK